MVSEISKKALELLFNLIAQLSRTAKIVLLVILFVALFFFGRCGLGGQTTRDILWSILPYETWFDCQTPPISLFLDFEILKDGSYQNARLGAAYNSKSQIRLTFGASKPCWLIVFALDSADFHHIIPQNQDGFAVKFEPSAPIKSEIFQLDATKGVEIYAVVASYTKFNVDDIRKQISNNNFSRGPNLNRPFKLQEQFFYRSIYFENRGR